ncbi:hypothetical protein, partial [Microbispora sp. NPDC049633]|uniref:hypothetical protein n=1 Tax=Microbispora sp. NPDC049633 TaxID=3154355 RepID=UPI0034394158
MGTRDRFSPRPGRSTAGTGGTSHRTSSTGTASSGRPHDTAPHDTAPHLAAPSVRAVYGIPHRPRATVPAG